MSDPRNVEREAAKDAEIERLRKLLAAIQDALKKRGLFAFEHIDGTVSINER